MSDFFKGIDPVPFKGPDSDDPLAFRFYEPDRMVLGKRMEDQLRMAVAYWHSFAWPGGDPFGGQTFERPWFGDGMAAAQLKAEVAFEMFDDPRRAVLHLPRPRHRARGQEPRRDQPQRPRDRRLFRATHGGDRHRAALGHGEPLLQPPLHGRRRHQPRPGGLRLCRRAGEDCLDVTHELSGANYVLWGGREGYETLLNTDMGQELDQMGRFLSMVVDYKHKIGFPGTILIEPKPQEPTKHQYDYDVATVFGFLQRFGLEKEVKVNIEIGHALLAGHSFEHEIATAVALGIFGSVDANRNDYQSGWDTDQFPNNVPETALAIYYILKGGGFTTGGFNFDFEAAPPVARPGGPDRRATSAAWTPARAACSRRRR